ncbi:hypothetical protein LNKW23_43340 [Paralimibaculum aggregatum]|uniref:Uncharacterized protein n=1 Tax=Paralimibaculum aggregatum TaxID=3036245 RepID=A0ABQ6LSQ3_9RHOB|nr:hypothetical protein [Limibaculum sp. NKW23]GMG85118.1 hypothetical protein LNKW23_43340 [Limibaculum sp. NKW23]
MEPWSIIAKRWPDRNLEIRRRCAVDADYRSIVSDYVEARSALDRWRRSDPAGSGRVADYERLVRELDAEIERSFVTHD